MKFGLDIAAFKTLFGVSLWQPIPKVCVRGPNLGQEVLVSDLLEDKLRLAGILVGLGSFCLEKDRPTAVVVTYLKNSRVCVVGALECVLTSRNRLFPYYECERYIRLNGTLSKRLRFCTNVAGCNQETEYQE